MLNGSCPVTNAFSKTILAASALAEDLPVSSSAVEDLSI